MVAGSLLAQFKMKTAHPRQAIDTGLLTSELEPVEVLTARGIDCKTAGMPVIKPTPYGFALKELYCAAHLLHVEQLHNIY